MRAALGWLRRVAGREDRREAFTTEERVLASAIAPATVDPRFQDAMRSAARGRHVRIGRTAVDAATEVKLRLRDLVGHGHGLVVGGSGSGKTRVMAGIVRWLVAENARSPVSVGVWVQDHKSEFVALLRELIADLVHDLPPAQAEGLLDRIVVIDPFSASSLVPMQVLKLEDGARPEDLAFEVTGVVNRMGGADLGVRQDDFTYHLLLLGVTTGRSLPGVAALLADPVALLAAARASPHESVRAYFGAADRKPLTQTSLEGVRARLNRLLRLPATRLMLDGSASLSFKKLLAENVVLVDVGSPPFGCEDVGRFWSGLITLKLTRAIFERSPADALRPVFVGIDEWQEGLSAGGEVAEQYEKILSMARSRGVSLWLVSQSLAGAARVSATLPKVVATNTNVQMCFRASPEDARTMAHLLPVSGRRRRAAAAPWEESSRSPFLSRAEELELLMRDLAALPDRTFYFWDRRAGAGAELVRAATVEPAAAGFRNARVAERLRDGAIGVPIGVLQGKADLARTHPHAPQSKWPTSPSRRPT